MITPDILQQFKDRMHITHHAEDSNLQELLSFSVAYVKRICGDFLLEGEEMTDVDKQAKELVFERTRFAYNDALEYFEDSFSSEIHTLGFELSWKGVSGDETTTV